MIIERDVRVPTRFGYDLFIDIFRPLDQTLQSPPIIAWTPYGKSDPAPLATIYPTSGVKAEWMSAHTIFEAPDPVYWVGKGYVVITADTPGTWHGTTSPIYVSPEEAQAFYDLVEWAGVQPWSNGRVGLSGVSYLAVMQWRVAELRPPHLAAINPWEGWSDTYREVVRHGGIPDTSFWPYIQVRWGAADHPIEDLWAETREHPFFDAFWASKAARLEQIETPAYVCASWSDHGLHTRGTLEGFKKISSQQKWLEVHGRKKWAHYYDPESVERQRAFFDHFLKGVGDPPAWPRVRVEVRDRYQAAVSKSAHEWPIEGTDYVKVFLDGSTGTLVREAPTTEASVTYDSLDDAGLAQFDLHFDQAAELVGHMKVRLFAEARGSDDMDLFVAIEKLDREGRKVPFAHFGVFDDGPVALGWLRASHRELDPATTEFQPVLKHQREQKLSSGEVAQLDIEIWPSGTRFEAGETLRLIVKGRDIYNYPKPMVYSRHEDTVNLGEHVLYTGAERASYLLLPFVTLEP
jgi:predicted acyl esterase